MSATILPLAIILTDAPVSMLAKGSIFDVSSASEVFLIFTTRLCSCSCNCNAIGFIS